MTVELTVAIPARNAAPWIGAALDSVLRQEGVAFVVVVVDDASDDATAAEVSRRADSRLRLVRHTEQRGIGACHNVILRMADTPFITHVDADDVVLPGAFAAMLAALRDTPAAGQAYCDFDCTAAEGIADPASSAEWRASLARARRPPIPVRRHLLVHGMVVNHLRTYRREALLDAGGFDEALPWAVDYDMALRLAERWDFVHVPETLYAKRILPGGASESVRHKPLRFWAMRWRLARHHLRARTGRLLGYSTLAVHLLLLAGLADAIRATVAGVMPWTSRSRRPAPGSRR